MSITGKINQFFAGPAMLDLHKNSNILVEEKYMSNKIKKSEFERTLEFAGVKPLQQVADEISKFLQIERIKIVMTDECPVPFQQVIKNQCKISKKYDYEKQLFHLCRFIRLYSSLKKAKFIVDTFQALLFDYDSAAFTAFYLYYREGIKCNATGDKTTPMGLFVDNEVVPSLGKKYTSIEQFKRDALSRLYLPGLTANNN